MSTLLRDGTRAKDPRLAALMSFDEQSREYPISALTTTKRPRSYTWRIGPPSPLDQGREGACVGFAWVHELMARPSEVRTVATRDAMDVYRAAQKIDEWAGEAYEGTSILAGAKILQQRGWIQQYRWAFGIDELIMGVGYNGPAVIGIPWYSGMYDPDADGVLRIAGSLVGRHAILTRRVNMRRETFTVRNSWGRWGKNGSGDAEVPFETMERLLKNWGEACFAVARTVNPNPRS